MSKRNSFVITALKGLTLSSPSLVFIDGVRDSAQGDFKIPTDIADLKKHYNSIVPRLVQCKMQIPSLLWLLMAQLPYLLWTMLTETQHWRCQNGYLKPWISYWIELNILPPAWIDIENSQHVFTITFFTVMITNGNVWKPAESPIRESVTSVCP